MLHSHKLLHNCDMGTHAHVPSPSLSFCCAFCDNYEYAFVSSLFEVLECYSPLLLAFFKDPSSFAGQLFICVFALIISFSFICSLAIMAGLQYLFSDLLSCLLKTFLSPSYYRSMSKHHFRPKRLLLFLFSILTEVVSLLLVSLHTLL